MSPLVYPAPPGGNDDFTPGSVIKSTEHDGNFAEIQSYLTTDFVGTANIQDDAVTTAKIADDAVTTAKIIDDAITSAKIANDAVGTTEIDDDAVTTPKILNSAVTNGKIANDAVTTAKIIDDAVTTAKILNLAVTDAKIADLDGAKIQANSIPASALGNDIAFPINVTDEVIQFLIPNGSATLAASDVSPLNIVVTNLPGTITYTEGVDYSFSAPNTITHINTGAIPVLTDVEVDYIAAAPGPPANSVGSAQIIDGSILDADINAAAAIALSKLATDPLARANHTGTQLAATISDFAAAVASIAVGGDLTGTVSNAQLAANSVTAAEIAADAVTASEIASGAVTAPEIGVLPAGRIKRTGTGSALAVGGVWQNIYFPTLMDTLQGGADALSIYNDGTNDAGFTVNRTGWYHISLNFVVTNASAGVADQIGCRIRNLDDAETLAGDLSDVSPTPTLDGRYSCSVIAKVNNGERIVGQFNADVAGPVPDVDSSLSMVYVSA